jgi:hypothetical protein
MDLDVLSFGWEWVARQDHVALLLASDWTDATGRQHGVWRVEFERTLAFRRSGSAWWYRRLPRVDPSSWRALREIQNSAWMEEVVHAHGQSSVTAWPYSLHHYAVVDETVALYELVASGYTVQRLDENEAAQALQRATGAR